MSYANIVKRGTRLEYLAASVFQGQDYLVRRAVPVRYGPKGQDATDIDVFGVKFTQLFQPHHIVCDCKERQRNRPYERIFWAKGLSGFVNAAETYVCLSKSSLDIVDFAKTGEVCILTQKVLQDCYAKMYTGDYRPYGMANGSVFEPFYQRMLRLLGKERNAARLLFQARTLYLVKNPYVAINVSLSYLRSCGEVLKRIHGGSEDIFDLWRFVTADLIVITSLLLLYIASDTIRISGAERKRYIVQRLTYGDVSPEKAHEIFRLAKELALEEVKTLVPEATRQTLLPFDIRDIDPPRYAHDVAGLVERAIASPSLYHQLPQVIDFLLFDQSLQNRALSEEQYRHTFSGPSQDELLKIARNVFVFVKHAVDLDLKAFWPKHENNLPRIAPRKQ